jgi:hypothetical protein
VLSSTAILGLKGVFMKISIQPSPTAFTEDGGLLLALPAISRSVVVEARAGEAIEVGECLRLNTAATTAAISTSGIAKTVAVSSSVEGALGLVYVTDVDAAGAQAMIGVAAQTAAAGARVRFIAKGYVPFVQSAGSVAAGVSLVPAAAGELITYASGTHTKMSVVGYALSDDADIGSAPDEVGCAAWLFDLGGDLVG